MNTLALATCIVAFAFSCVWLAWAEIYSGPPPKADPTNVEATLARLLCLLSGAAVVFLAFRVIE